MQAFHRISASVRCGVESNQLAGNIGAISREGSKGQIHVTTAVSRFCERGQEHGAVGLHEGLEGHKVGRDCVHQLNGLNGGVRVSASIGRRVEPENGILLWAISGLNGIHV